MPKDIGRTLKEYRISSKISVKEISERLTQKGYKASESTIYSWENGNSSPTPGALLEMCDAYGIKDILLAFGYDGYNEDGSIQLNIKEQGLIEKYRALDPSGQAAVNYILSHETTRVQQIAELRSRPGVVEFPQDRALEPNAAHERTDVEITAEMQEHDDAIMDAEDF